MDARPHDEITAPGSHEIEYDRIDGRDALEFQKVYRWCSNFWPARVTLDGVEYPTVEHAYQAAKTLNKALRKEFLECPSPGAAKKKSKWITARDRRPDWDRIKVDVMRDLVLQKFTRHEHLKKALLLTGQAALVEGNWHGDRFWGQVEGEGCNYMGMLLMQTRLQISLSEKPAEGRRPATPARPV